jgi:hypothetical protein
MKKFANIILLLSILSSLFGCGDNKVKENHDIDLVEITSKAEEGFPDIVLKIVGSNHDNTEIIAKGKHNQETVGLKIMIEGFKIKFVSLGQESDNLIKALSTLYELPTSDKFSKSKISFDGILMSAENGEHQYKLFFDPNDESGLYSELYLNINWTTMEIELKEKDEEYRSNLIKAMTK